MAYRLSPRAQVDVDDIWDHTARNWSTVQAEKYVRVIGDTILSIAENPRLGRPCDDIRRGYFRILAGSHVVFYRLTGSDVEVIRILHGRMGFDRYL